MRVAVCRHVLLQPTGEVFVLIGCLSQLLMHGFSRQTVLRCQNRRSEVGFDAVKLGLRDGVWCAVLREDALVLGSYFLYVTRAFCFHQNFDTGFVNIVTTAPAVVNAHHGFQKVKYLVPRQELANHRADNGCAPHSATGHDAKPDFACGIALHMQTHIVPCGGGAVFQSAADGDFEFARQKCKFRVQRAPLAQNFCKRARVHNFIYRHTGAFVAGDIAYAVTAGLNTVHVHACQQVHHIGAFVQRNPVVLQVLTGGEMGVVFRQSRCGNAADGVLRGLGAFEQTGLGRVVVACNGGQHTQLRTAEFAVGHSHTQHGCIALHIPAVLQTQRTEFVVA